MTNAHARWQREGEPSVARRLGQIGVLGWIIVTPMLIGVFAGRWLDRAFNSGLFCTAPLLMLGLRWAAGPPGDGCRTHEPFDGLTWPYIRRAGIGRRHAVFRLPVVERAPVRERGGSWSTILLLLGRLWYWAAADPGRAPGRVAAVADGTWRFLARFARHARLRAAAP